MYSTLLQCTQVHDEHTKQRLNPMILHLCPKSKRSKASLASSWTISRLWRTGDTFSRLVQIISGSAEQAAVQQLYHCSLIEGLPDFKTDDTCESCGERVSLSCPPNAVLGLVLRLTGDCVCD